MEVSRNEHQKTQGKLSVFMLGLLKEMGNYGEHDWTRRACASLKSIPSLWVQEGHEKLWRKGSWKESDLSGFKACFGEKDSSFSLELTHLREKVERQKGR